MGCISCGSGRFSLMYEDERFVYYSCTSCGNTNAIPKGFRIV